MSERDLSPSDPGAPSEAQEPSAARAERKRVRNRLRLGIVGLVLIWTFFYNVLIKGHSAGRAFFRVLDTISDDFVLGATVTIAVGVLIVVLYSATKLYTQVIANIYSFRILETLLFEELAAGRWRGFVSKLLRFDEQPTPSTACPRRVSSLLLSFAFIYVMSWVYVVLFTEALFFLSWSAGVDLRISPENPQSLLMLPTLALAIPFSARVMAYLRYPHAQDYADFMPGAVFVLVVVSSLGLLFESEDQASFLLRMWREPAYRLDFLRNGVFLAFIPVFFEGAFWLLELGREDDADAEGG